MVSHRPSHHLSPFVNPALTTLVNCLRKALASCQTILDVGCGNNSPVRFVPAARLVGIDGFAPAIEEARVHNTHDEYHVGDVRKLPQIFVGSHFDACVALDVIEHLPKNEGWRLLEAMESLAQRAVVIFTPNGFVPQKSKNGDLQEHLSGWSVNDFAQRGYEVLGMCGPKRLRGEYHMIRCRPRVLWALVALLADLSYTRSHPRGAAALLAIKKLRS